MLDQPSQAWFPQEPSAWEAPTAGDQDEDLEAVRRLYWFLWNASQGEKAPQIIVVDHARLSPKWFQSAVVKNWHGPTVLSRLAGRCAMGQSPFAGHELSADGRPARGGSFSTFACNRIGRRS